MHIIRTLPVCRCWHNVFLYIIFNAWNCGNITLPHTGTITFTNAWKWYDCTLPLHIITAYMSTYVQHTGVWTAGSVRLHRMLNLLTRLYMTTGNLIHCMLNQYNVRTMHLLCIYLWISQALIRIYAIVHCNISAIQLLTDCVFSHRLFCIKSSAQAVMCGATVCWCMRYGHLGRNPFLNIQWKW